MGLHMTDRRIIAAQKLWFDLLRQADKDGKWIQSNEKIDYAGKFRDFGKFFLWLCLHGYRPGMAVARRNPCDPFGNRNCYLKYNHSSYDQDEMRIMAKMSASGVSCGIKTTTRLYGIWKGIKRRCLNPKDHDYADYGGRGIKICSEWMDYRTFAKWAWEHGYAKDLTIDRVDVDGNYCPSNCRWAGTLEQMLNTRETGKIYKNIRLRVNRMRAYLQEMPDDAVVTLVARRDCLPTRDVIEDDYLPIPESERIDLRRPKGKK